MIVKRSGPFSILVLCVCFIFTAVSAIYADVGRTEEVSVGISGRVLCVRGVEWTDVLYAGTENGLYRTMDGGSSWRAVGLPGGVSDVDDVAAGGEDIFITAGGHVYAGADGTPWRWLPGIKNVVGIIVPGGKGKDNIAFVWSREELLRIEGGTRRKIYTASTGDTVEDVAVCDDTLFVVSGGSIYCSPDMGETWRRETLFKRHDDAEGADEASGDSEEEERAVTASMDSYGSGGVAVSTAKGIFMVDTSGHVWRNIDTTGLPAARIRKVVYTGNGLFAATDRRVFLYLYKERRWQPFFEKTFPGAISFLEKHIDRRGGEWLWIATGEYLYKQAIDFLPEEENFPAANAAPGRRPGSGEGSYPGPGLDDFFCPEFREPSIQDVHRMAIEYAEVSPAKIKKWRRGAKWKALMPKLSLGFSESRDDNVEIYKSATTSYVVTGPREIDTDWSIDLTWDLSDLVWNDAQTNIDVRSRLMVQLRDEILEEITRLYFERKRLLLETAEQERGKSSELNREELLNKRIRIQELTAYIDALTGGKFSEMMGRK